MVNPFGIPKEGFHPKNFSFSLGALGHRYRLCLFFEYYYGNLLCRFFLPQQFDRNVSKCRTSGSGCRVVALSGLRFLGGVLDAQKQSGKSNKTPLDDIAFTLYFYAGSGRRIDLCFGAFDQKKIIY